VKDIKKKLKDIFKNSGTLVGLLSLIAFPYGVIQIVQILICSDE